MRKAQLVTLLALFLIGAPPAQGQGRSVISTSAPLTNVRAYEELRAFGACVARTQRRAALAVIATVPGSAEEVQVLRRFIYGERETCLFGGTTMSMPAVFARGAVAEGLLRSGGVPDTYRLPVPTPAEARDLHGSARCYTAAHRAEVQSLLQTAPGSRNEVSAVAALWNDLKACMPGKAVRLNAPWIRFLLAEALLRTGPVTTESGR